mmetsp:Transcript_8822/g.13088  ORF Transcript_8822/g.13088 Transcript_8822/m.13088 type:complete len:90 (+) Transcript_8822:25-294(+)
MSDDNMTLEQWQAAENIKWEEELASRKCKECGSTKVTTYSVGRPHGAWVEFHKKKTEELGYTTHVFGGCMPGQGQPRSKCADCGKADVL